MRGQMLKGHLDMLLLAIIDSGATHGYAIAEALRRVTDGGFDLPDGTIYPALRRLEGRSLVQSSWTAAPGRRRRHYTLTPAGASALAQQKEEWSTFEQGVRAVLAAAT